MRLENKVAIVTGSARCLTMTEAIKKDKIRHGDIVLPAAFGAGLTYGTTLLRY